ncbi:MAG: META domain-containing protein [Sphingomonas sp.]|uniref:META domain-containing protein n=1 Tax=Sphingomonas sp. TaxID=28214 RepID=UPI00184B1644|nr:META domain-containing protein [Sphingomonas sp.]MBA3666101.1 META domain-containing protein [Sphingomonas sp.]
MRGLVSILLLSQLLAGCATQSPPTDVTIDPRGQWTVVAVNGEPTGGGSRFNFLINPPSGSAQFGCNRGGGGLSVERGLVAPTSNWAATLLGCLPQEQMRFERRGFEIASQPMAIETPPGGGIRLRNRIGSIDLVRAP